MLVMMDDSAPMHKKMKLIKTYKTMLHRKRTVVAELCWETYSKNVTKWSIKAATGIIYPVYQRGTLRERFQLQVLVVD